MPQFALAFKSSIDKMVNDLAVSKDLKLVDMDDVTAVTDLLSSSKDALVWEFLTFDEAPKAPLYSFVFRVGARTTNDAANYNILSLVGDIKDIFTVGKSYDVMDYSGVVVGPKQGFMYVSDVRVEPQEYDKQSGIRTASVYGKAASG